MRIYSKLHSTKVLVTKRSINFHSHTNSICQKQGLPQNDAKNTLAHTQRTNHRSDLPVQNHISFCLCAGSKRYSLAIFAAAFVFTRFGLSDQLFILQIQVSAFILRMKFFIRFFDPFHIISHCLYHSRVKMRSTALRDDLN